MKYVYLQLGCINLIEIVKLILQKPDAFGALASTLCIIHCLATPLLFIAQTCAMGGCETAPVWWKSLDYLFLMISFIAIYRSTKTTSKNVMKYALWLCWVALFLLIVNEKTQWVSLSETFTYFIAFTLAALHIYNMNYCQCKTDKCCVRNG